MIISGRTSQPGGGLERSAGATEAPEGATAADCMTAQTACTLLDTLPIGIFVTERSGRVRYANTAMRQMLGIPREAGLLEISPVSGRTFDPADRKRFWDQLEADGEVHGFEVAFTRTDGRRIDVVLNARLRAGEPPCCEGSAEDISARKSVERDVDSLNHMLIEATRESGMAEAARAVLHKAGNILTSVNLTVDDLRDSVRESGVLNLCLLAECVERERGQLARFLAEDPVGRQFPDLLKRVSTQLKNENAHLDSGLGKLEQHCSQIRDSIVGQAARAGEGETFEILELEPLVSIVTRLENEECRRGGIALANRVDPAIRLMGDRLRLVQVILHLVQHYRALGAAAGEAPQAVVTAHDEGVWLAIAVSPNGEASPDSTRRKLSFADGEGNPTLQRCLLAARAAGATLYDCAGNGLILHLPTGNLTAPSHDS